MNRKLRTIIALTVLFAVILTLLPLLGARAFSPLSEPESPCVYLVNTDTGTVLYAKNADQYNAPATLAQIMTAILALESGLDPAAEQIEAVPELFNALYNRPTYTADIRPGEVLTLRDMLYAMMIQSSYEAASAIAIHIAGGTAAFARMMNEKAAAIGAANTLFVNPHGMDDPEAHTTARDMALITQYAIELPGFLEMATATYYQLPATAKAGARTLIPNNTLLRSGNRDFYRAARGIKAGTTSLAGRCVVTTVSGNGYNYLLVILGGPQQDQDGKALGYNTALKDARALLDWAINDFKLVPVMLEGDAVAEVPVRHGTGADSVLLAAAADFFALLPDKADASAVQKIFDLPESVDAPVEKGQRIGKVTLFVEGAEIGAVDLVAGADVKYSAIGNLMDTATAIFTSTWFIAAAAALCLILFIYFIAMIRINRGRIRRRKIKRRRY